MNRPTSIVIVSLVFAVFADSGWPAALSVSELQISSGAISERMGDFEEAKAHYQKAIDLDPSAQNLLRLGLLAEQMGDLPLAVRSLTRSLSTPGKHTPAAQVLFRLYIESKNDQAALKLAEQFRWTGGTDYCQVGNRKLNTETLAFLAMLIHPERAPCLLTIAKNLTEDGLPTLARLAVELGVEASPLRGEGVAATAATGGDASSAEGYKPELTSPPASLREATSPRSGEAISGWTGVLEKLNRTVRAAYLDAQPEVSGSTLVLWFRYGFHHKKAQEQSSQLLPLVREWLGDGVKVDYRLREVGPEPARAAKTASAEDDPFVREVVRRFDGRVTRVKEISE